MPLGSGEKHRGHRRWAVLVVAVVGAGGLSACASTGPGAGGDRGWTSGRVMSKTDREYCVSPDRGATTSCVPLDQADGAAEVGMCVRLTDEPEPAAVRLTVADEAACASGDLGDEAPNR